MERLNPGNGDKTENDWNTPDSYSTLGTLTYLIYCFRKVLDTQRLLKNVDCKGWKNSEANRLVFIAAKKHTYATIIFHNAMVSLALV